MIIAYRQTKEVANKMSYYNKSSDKPDCFANDSEFNERSSACSGCGFRHECSKAIDEKARNNNMSYYTRPRAASPSPAPATSNYVSTGVPVRPATAQAPVAAQRGGVIRAADVDFNFNKPIFGQFTTYLVHDIAQVTTERVHSLIVASRENYRHKVMSDEE